MEPLRIEITQSELVPEITILTFEGDLDTASIGNISNCFDLILEKNTSYVVAEMSKVTSISSAALGELMGGRKALVEQDGDLVLAGLSLNIKSKLTQMGANKIFKFHNDVRSAINAYEWEFEGRPEVLVLSFPPYLKFVPPVRQLISRVARQKKYSRRDSFRIETIVDEICNNAVEHGLTNSPAPVELSIRIDRKKIEIKVMGPSDPTKIECLKELLKPLQQKDADVPFDQKRGRGLTLIKMLSNELNIDFSENGTSVQVTKLKEE
jgi:anti-anti-sigma factor